jgi:hypothetical protein
MSISAPPDEPEEVEDETPPPKPTPVDDWSLVRTRSGQSGWALTSRLVMAIPVEVAQYAEGHRIVSYFSLGEVQDGAAKKHTWLWTTLSAGPQSYDFDSFRVFIWSLRRHRYETAYIERKVKGYQPVLLHDVQLSSGTQSNAPAGYPGFSFCVEKDDGKRYLREYAFLTNVVRFAGERPCNIQETPLLQASSPVSAAVPVAPSQPPETFAGKIRNGVVQLRKRIFGR